MCKNTHVYVSVYILHVVHVYIQYMCSCTNAKCKCPTIALPFLVHHHRNRIHPRQRSTICMVPGEGVQGRCWSGRCNRTRCTLRNETETCRCILSLFFWVWASPSNNPTAESWGRLVACIELSFHRFRVTPPCTTHLVDPHLGFGSRTSLHNHRQFPTAVCRRNPKAS